MTSIFDDAYAKYLSCLAKLDSVVDISEKNRLFKDLTEQLSQLEKRISNGETVLADEDFEEDDGLD